jgi:phosphate transport system protein
LKGVFFPATEEDQDMRDTYREQLDDILVDLVHMSQAVSFAVRSSTTALLEADIHLAEQVIGDDELLDAKQADIEQRAFTLLARQAPVAGELRILVATLRMVAELERMGDLAAHVAKIARLRYPELAVPEALRANFIRMGDVAEKMVVSAGQTLSDRNIQVAQELHARDEEMDELRRTQFRVLLSDDWPYGVETAVDVALLGRYYERIADHAASVARRVIYVVTGEFPETEHWPQP